MASYVELKEQAEDLMRKAELARKAEIGGAIAEIKATMAAYGITVADLGIKAHATKINKAKSAKSARTAKTAKAGNAKAAKPRKPVAAKYRDPESKATWSGRGRVPRWLAAHEAAGRAREEFAVQQ